MTDDELIAALRDLGDRAAYEPHMHHAAADRIEALVGERDRFEAALGRACLVGGTTYLVEKAQKAEARVERLEAALRDVLRYLENDLANVPSADPERRIARAALKGHDHE